MQTATRQHRCPSAKRLIAMVSEEAMASARQQLIAAHLGQCALCRDEVAAVQAFLQGDLAAEVAEAYDDVTALTTGDNKDGQEKKGCGETPSRRQRGGRV